MSLIFKAHALYILSVVGDLSDSEEVPNIVGVQNVQRMHFTRSGSFESVLTTSMSKKGVYKIFGVPDTSEFTKPPGSYEL